MSRNQKPAKWKLAGLDTFSDEEYSLEGSFDTEEQAKAAGRKQLKKLEQTQPSASSGGQSFYGLQDRVFVVRPDGTKYRLSS